MSWVNDILGKKNDEDEEMNLDTIKESAKVFSSALLNKRDQKKRKQNKGANDYLGSSEEDDDTYFS